jgi:hypothetical protein
MPTLYFEGTDDPIDAGELAHYLYLLKAAYSRALKFVPSDENVLMENLGHYREAFLSRLEKEDAEPTVSELFFNDDRIFALRLTRISKSSPLEITASCLISALVLATIFSGGEADLKELKFHLPPLGVGIRSLRKALNMKGESKRDGR